MKLKKEKEKEKERENKKLNTSVFISRLSGFA